MEANFDLEKLDSCKTINKVDNPFEGINTENVYNENNIQYLPPVYYNYDYKDNKIFININLSRLKDINLPISININI